MNAWVVGLGRIIGIAVGVFAGVVAVQLMRLRRMDFLPGHPGFYVNHVVNPMNVAPGPPRLRLAVLGDSTAAGVGVERAEDSLPYQLAQRLADRHGRAVHVVSYGWAGARMADVLRDQLPRALQPLRATDSQPFLPRVDIIAVVVGANDATHQTPRRLFRAEVRDLLSAVRAANPEARLVLAGIPTFRGALRTVEPLMFLADQYARLLRPAGREEALRAGAAYADLAREVPRRVDPAVPILSEDRFHPSAVGYAIWADVIVEALDDQLRPVAPLGGATLARGA